MMNQLFYLRAVASNTPHGNMDIRLGELYLQENEWGLAIKALQNGLKKGHLKKQYEAYILLGLAYMKVGAQALAQDCLYKAIDTYNA